LRELAPNRRSISRLPLPGADLLNHAGSETAFHLFDAYEFLNKMWRLRDDGVVDIVAGGRARQGKKIRCQEKSLKTENEVSLLCFERPVAAPE